MRTVDIFLDNNPELVKTAASNKKPKKPGVSYDPDWLKKFYVPDLKPPEKAVPLKYLNPMTGGIDYDKIHMDMRRKNLGPNPKQKFTSTSKDLIGPQIPTYRKAYVGSSFTGPGRRFKHKQPSMFNRLSAKGRKVYQSSKPVGKFIGRHGKAFTGLALISGLVGATKMETFLEDRSRQKGYTNMIMESPDLRKNKNKLQVLQFYNALWEMNPTIAKNPHTAAAFIRDQFAIGNEALHINTVSTLLGARKQDTRASKPTNIIQSDSARNIIEGIIGI